MDCNVILDPYVSIVQFKLLLINRGTIFYDKPSRFINDYLGIIRDKITTDNF